MDNRVVENNRNIVPGEWKYLVEKKEKFRLKQAIAAAHVRSEVTRHWSNLHRNFTTLSVRAGSFISFVDAIPGIGWKFW